METATDKAEQNRALQQPTGIYDQEVGTSEPSPSPTGRYCRNFRQNSNLPEHMTNRSELPDQAQDSTKDIIRTFSPLPEHTASGSELPGQLRKKCPRDNSKLSIEGSPKPLGALRRNFGEMMNTPKRGYAPKITASNSLQLPESQILAKNTMN
jgi:hypothetical protein